MCPAAETVANRIRDMDLPAARGVPGSKVRNLAKICVWAAERVGHVPGHRCQAVRRDTNAEERGPFEYASARETPCSRAARECGDTEPGQSYSIRQKRRFC